MSLLSDETEVFTGADDDRCATMFLARRRVISKADRARASESALACLDQLGEKGWALSVRQMFSKRPEGPWAYDTGFAHDVDIVGVFEAPTITDALSGTTALQDSGWGRLMTTQWLIGPREFAPVPSPVPSTQDRPWGFLALWQWNDAWQAATLEQRRKYDAECDVAFKADLNAGIDIAGRHRLDWATGWDHLGLWEADTFTAVDAAMREHERVADFKFTTSRHYLGRRTHLAHLIGGTHA